MSLIPYRYFLNATYDFNLHAPVVGYDSVFGFGADRNGFQNLWVHNVLSQLHDNSYLFVGGAYHLLAGNHTSPVYNRSSFDLKYDLNDTFTPGPGGGVGEASPTNVTPPLPPHTWDVTFRWRAVGGTPQGRDEDDLALNILIDVLGGPQTFIHRTWAQSSPTFRTETVSIRNKGDSGYTSPQFGFTVPTFASEALRDTLANPAEGPNYLPVQLAWMTVTGPLPIPAARAVGRPGYRRGHFI